MPYIGAAASKLIEVAMDKYDVPEWVRPYLYKYASRHKLDAIKFALSLINVGRKKGEVTKQHVTLPNGMKFRLDSVMKLISLFFHGQEAIALLEEEWVASHTIGNPEYEAAYSALSDIDQKHARAIKNLMEGLGGKITDEIPTHIKPLIERMRLIDDWNERIIASGIILNYSYLKTFGPVFFKIFYPISPEFMRNLSKAFMNKELPERWDLLEARKIIKSGAVDPARIKALYMELLPLIGSSVKHNMSIAKELKVVNEMELLSEILIAYPLHELSELGVVKDPVAQTQTIMRMI